MLEIVTTDRFQRGYFRVLNGTASEARNVLHEDYLEFITLNKIKTPLIS